MAADPLPFGRSPSDSAVAIGERPAMLRRPSSSKALASLLHGAGELLPGGLAIAAGIGTRSPQGAGAGGAIGEGARGLLRIAQGYDPPEKLRELPASMRRAAYGQALAMVAGQVGAEGAMTVGRGLMAAAARVGPKFVSEFRGSLTEMLRRGLIPGSLGRLLRAPERAAQLQREAAQTEEAIGRTVTEGPASWRVSADRIAERAIEQANKFRDASGRVPLTETEEKAIAGQVRKFGTDVIGRRSFGRAATQSGQFTANEARAIKQFADAKVSQLRTAERAGTAVGGEAASSLEKQIADETRAALHEIPGMRTAMAETQARIGARRALAPKEMGRSLLSPGYLAYHGGAAAAGALAGGVSAHGQDWQRRAVAGALLGQLALSPSSLGLLAQLAANPATRALLTYGTQLAAPSVYRKR